MLLKGIWKTSEFKMVFLENYRGSTTSTGTKWGTMISITVMMAVLRLLRKFSFDTGILCMSINAWNSNKQNHVKR
jgi:hypothetical protein